MENSSINRKFAEVLNEVPNFTTDETAQAGNRTYKYLNLATLLKAIKPVFEKHGLAFTQKSPTTTTTTEDKSSAALKQSSSTKPTR